MREFGRTFKENRTRGTDHGHGHGHGGVPWVQGGGIQDGRLAGEAVTVEAAQLTQNRDYKVLNEYCAVLGGRLARIYGLNADARARVFPLSATVDLRLI